jgi:tetratricopeptide (TPR) repeat protein
VRQWYRTIAALFASHHLWAELRAHLARARRLYPADAEILAANGRLHETFAAPRIQSFLETVGRANLTDSIGSPRSNLRQAETFFRKAVELDGGSVEARLHLGRVMTLEGRHEEAANQLRAATAAGNSWTQYNAWLFLGVAEQSLGRADRARECFDKAAALYPRAQSAYLALSQLARRSGDRASALAAIGQVLGLSASDRQREDPWLTYLQGSAAEAQTRLSELRAVLFLTQAER